AFQDAMPVAMSTAGLVALGVGVGRRMGAPLGRLAIISAVTIGLGGAAKVSWKLLAAGAEVDVAWLDDLLFPLLAVGFVGMARLVILTRRGEQVSRGTSVRTGILVAVTAGLIAAAVLVDGAAGLRLARTIAIVASLTMSWQLLAVGTGVGDRLSVAFIVGNVIATLSLAGLARVEVQTLGLQWIEQSVNTASQFVFLLAALRLASPGTAWKARNAGGELATAIVFKERRSAWRNVRGDVTTGEQP
ncbi:MAG: hypothetical protein ACI867_001910, partial [Glaciecola sp.]